MFGMNRHKILKCFIRKSAVASELSCPAMSYYILLEPFHLHLPVMRQVPFSFSQYCTRSCLTIMAGVGVAHKLLKKTKQRKDNNTNLWQSHLSQNYLQAVLRDKHTKPCPCAILDHYILDFNPSTVSTETASVVSPFKVAIVLGKKEYLCILMVILKRVVPLEHSHAYMLFTCVAQGPQCGLKNYLSIHSAAPPREDYVQLCASEKAKLIEEIVFDCRRIKSKNSVS